MGWFSSTPSKSNLGIKRVYAREVLDSRGKPTVEAEVHLTDGTVGSAIVPSGASTGSAEAVELRDGDPNRYDGQGVLNAVRNVNEVLGPRATKFGADLRTIDGMMMHEELLAHGLPDDGPEFLAMLDKNELNFAKLGANSVLAVSMATAQACAASQQVPLYQYLNSYFLEVGASIPPCDAVAPRMPLPMTNMISGGKHAGGNLDFQDILVMPNGAPDYRTGLEWIVRIYRRLGDLLNKSGYEGYLVGDEGGYGPRLTGNREAVEFVVRAIEAAKLKPGEQVTIAIDVAATHFFRDGHYHLAAEKGRKLSSSEMIDRLEQWVRDFPITSIEDGLAEEDWAGWTELTQRLGSRVHIVGDDLFATNSTRVFKGRDLQAGNAVLIKMNQIGTVSQTLLAVVAARSSNFATIVSARSGESEDTFMSDLAVAVAADRIKIGSIARSERLAKYNRLLRVEELLRKPDKS